MANVVIFFVANFVLTAAVKHFENRLIFCEVTDMSRVNESLQR